MNWIEYLKRFVGRKGGTQLAAGKSLVDTIGANGDDTLSHDFSEASVIQFLHGMHNEVIILFVIPEAVDSINAHNSAILTELQKTGEVVTITQTDALNYPDFESISICILGTDNGTAWTLANLAQIKIVPNLPLVSCDASTAAYFEIGTDGGDAAAKIAITAITNIKASILGGGFHAVTGLATGANTVSSSTIYNTLDMSDANLTETWYAYESVDANTDVILGEVRRIQPDGSLGIDETGVEVPATMAFYGCAYSFNDLNTLGKSVFRLLCEKLIFSATIGSTLTIAGDIGDVSTKLFGNISTKFGSSIPLAAFLAGNTGGLGSEMPNSVSVYDVLGGFSGDGGAAQDDSAKASLDLAHTELSRAQSSRSFWSVAAPVADITISTTQATKSVTPTVVIPSGTHGIPSGAVIDCVHILAKWRQTEDSSGADNSIDNTANTMEIQIDDDENTGWLSAYSFADDSCFVDGDVYSIGAGDIIEGITDIKARVDGADTYDIQLLNAESDGDSLILRDFMWGLRIWWH